MSPNEMPEHTRLALDDAVRELEQIRLSGVSKLVARTVLMSLRARRANTDVLAHVQRLEGELLGVAAILGRCAARLRDAEHAEVAREPEGATGWTQRRREITSAFADSDPDAPALWVRAWVTALERGDWARCAEIASLRGRPDQLRPIATALEAVAQALQFADPGAALDPLEQLVDRGGAGLDSQTRLDLLRVRILLREFSDRALVRDVATRAVDRASGTSQESLARVALAEVQLVNDGSADARTTLLEAVSADPPASDALVLLGEVEEAEGKWVEADRCYDHALAADSRAAEPALLRRVPARLLVRAAGRAGVDAAVAVDLLERALALGVPGDGEYPDADVWVSKGDHLLALSDERARSGDGSFGAEGERVAEAPVPVGASGSSAAGEARREAAAAYYQGGLRYSLSGYLPRALELFGTACELDPEVAEYRWERAEALRLSAHGSNDVVDRERLIRARELLGDGSLLRPEPHQAWVLVTESQVQEGLREPGGDPTLPLERALLLDPGYGLGYAFLAAALRRQGWLCEAEEAITQERSELGTTDPFIYSTRFDLCLDRGDHARALAMLDERARFTPVDDSHTLQRAQVLLRTGGPQRAIDALEDNHSEGGRLYRGLAMATLGREDPVWAGRAREEFYALWLDTRSSPRQDLAGYAAFWAGLLDEGLRTYQSLASRAPVELAYGRDLGQMLLVSGDVDAGRSALEEGVDRCPFAAELSLLGAVELPLVRSAVAGRPHEAAVDAVLDALGQRIAARVADLRQRRRPAGPVAVTAATARTALHDGAPLTALGLYLELVGSPELPEAGAGAALAAIACLDDADDAFAAGDHEAAQGQWGDVATAVAGVPQCHGVARSIQARRVVADVMDQDRWQAERWLARDLDLDDPQTRGALAGAADALVRDVDNLWALRDGIRRLMDHEGLPGEVCDAAAALLADLPVSRVYALDSGDAVTYSSFLSVRQLEMHLGRAAAEGLGEDALDQAVVDVVNRLNDTLGVRIPWVYHDSGRGLEPTQVDFKVYGRWVRSVLLHGERTSWLEQLTDELERTVRGQIYRLVGVDDVALWLEGWDLEHRDAPDWQPIDPVVDRLRLARLLRMLLREGVSVADRVSVLTGLDAAAGSDRARESATLETLCDVRRRLGRDALGVPAGAEVAVLPPGLETRLKNGLADGRPVWELARPEAFTLVSDLRAWLADQRSPHTVVIEDARLRPFVWRLLADRGVVVLSREEMGDE